MHPVVVSTLFRMPSAETPRPIVRWLTISMPMPRGPGIAISVEYSGPLSVTSRGNICILVATDRFSRRADMCGIIAAEFAAEVTTNILVNKLIPLFGCPRTILSYNGVKFCAKLSQDVFQSLSVHKLATISCHPYDNGGVERVNHTMAQMLAVVVNELQDD